MNRLAAHVVTAAVAALAAALLVPAASAQSEGAAASKAAPAARTAAAARDTLARVRGSKSITVAVSTDSLPFSYLDDKREPAGYSIDLCKRVIAQIGRATGVPNPAVRWVTGSAAERVMMIATGKADLDCANTTATLTRMADVDFSSLVFIEVGGIVVKGASGIRKLGDLSGKTIGVITGTTTEARIEAALKDLAINASVRRVKDGNEGMALVETGTIDAFASDKVKLLGLATQAKDPAALSMLQEDLSYEPLAFAVPRGDSAFRLEVNRALTQVYTSGEIESIYNAWFGSLGRPSNLLAAMFLLNSIPR